MVYQPALAATSLALPRIQLLGALVGIAVLATLSLTATVLLALATQQGGASFGRWLGLLLVICTYLPWLLAFGILPALFYTWRNRVRLARRLIVLMLVQFVSACVMGIAPLWLINQVTEANFESLQDTTFVSIANLRNAVLVQSQQRLSALGELISQELWPQAARVDSFGLGLVLDELRVKYQLDQLAVVDGSGRVLDISPATGSLEDFTALVVQRIQRGNTDFWLRDRVGAQLEQVLVLPRQEAEATGAGREPQLALWIEKKLSEAISIDLRELDNSVVEYQNSRSMRDGIHRGLLLVVINAIALLFFVAVYVAVYFGARLGARLGELTKTMRRLAEQDHPHGMVQVVGKDEITVVAQSFNALVTKQQRLYGDLQTIQAAMDSGLFVLDGANCVRSFNPAAAKLLQDDPQVQVAPLPNEQLSAYAKRLPQLSAFVATIGDPGQPDTGGEVNVGKRKLLVRCVNFPQGSAQHDFRLAMFTDISEPLAVQKYSTQQEVFQETLHGINNPLQVALLKTELLRDGLRGMLDENSTQQLNQNAGQILHQLERIRDQAQWWDSKGGLEKSILAQNVNAAVRACVENAECGTTEIELALAADLPVVLAETNLLQDALENLFANSQQQFAITAQEERHIKIATLQDQDKVILVFEDDAGGIDAERLPHIFERNVSYKTTGQGIGLTRVRESLDKIGATIKASLTSLHGRPGLRCTLTLRRAPDSFS